MDWMRLHLSSHYMRTILNWERNTILVNLQWYSKEIIVILIAETIPKECGSGMSLHSFWSKERCDHQQLLNHCVSLMKRNVFSWFQCLTNVSN